MRNNFDILNTFILNIPNYFEPTQTLFKKIILLYKHLNLSGKYLVNSPLLKIFIVVWKGQSLF